MLINVFLAAGRLLGIRTLLQVLSGRYHRPRLEERLFAFVDVRGATTIAEQLGDMRFQAFLVDFFRIIEVTALETGGEVHDYIGDQAMVTWPVTGAPRNTLRSPRPLHWIVHLTRQIAATRQAFKAGYGHTPDIRIGMHVGSVVVGEVGMFRTKLTCLGDAVNTTARVEELAHDYTACALMTQQVRERFELPEDLLAATWLGTPNLRGKHKPIGIYRIDLTDRVMSGRLAASQSSQSMTAISARYRPILAIATSNRARRGNRSAKAEATGATPT